ncbi:hypothetical protein U9M48_001519 [Paspalum notatum var. saurae]|uniref:Uncharacterized protein n=1 Tax=Paspalum notatum var. saurae TaxID=547442 RepID=A0AAQ3PEZ7_PASNO
MPKVIFDKLDHTALAPTAMCLQLADQSVRYPEGVTENVPVRIRNFLIPVDFVVQDMEIDSKTPLILGRPFLSTADATIDVGAGKVHLNINGKETFAFKPKVEQCNKVQTFKCQAPKNTPKVKVEIKNSTPKKDSLVTFMKKKLKMEAEIQQKEYERAMQSKRSRRQETRYDRPSPAPGRKAPAKKDGFNLTRPMWQVKEAPSNKVGTDNKLSTPTRRSRGRRSQRKAVPASVSMKL